MENSQIMMKEKLGFFGILKEALTIPYKNSNFTFLTFLSSIPLLCSMVIHEIIFQQTLIESARVLTEDPSCPPWGLCSPLYRYGKLIGEVSQKFLLPGLFYLGTVHLLDLINTIIIINSASMIYEGEKVLNLKEMLCRPLKGAGFKGPLITSFYALLLASLTLLGLVSLATQLYMQSADIFAMLSFGVAFVGLSIKYMEWSAIWNMGIVISILEEKHGYIALGVSAYLSRGSRQRGLLLMLVFFVWRLALRLSCLYAWQHKGGSEILLTTFNISLVCLGNVIKWVVFMIFFYDCKKRFLEKKIDVEDGRAVEAIK